MLFGTRARLKVAVGDAGAAEVEAVPAVLVQAAQRRAALVAVLAPDLAPAPHRLRYGLPELWRHQHRVSDVTREPVRFLARWRKEFMYNTPREKT